MIPLGSKYVLQQAKQKKCSRTVTKCLFLTFSPYIDTVRDQAEGIMEQIIPNPKELGAIVREARKEQHLTQEELAGLTGTGRRFISELEQGKTTLELGKVLLVLAALGIALYALSKWKK
ncbi:helix-turn-helix transcriptional regulator [Micavibrio aeruginosavorus]|nr:helix-turn-helix transcriptional regulator [Micavibrio aeruginosavorus]